VLLKSITLHITACEKRHLVIVSSGAIDEKWSQLQDYQVEGHIVFEYDIIVT
jgi:hypothetical protein